MDPGYADCLQSDKSNDRGRNHFVERIERQNGVHTIEAAYKLGFGTREYELKEIL